MSKFTKIFACAMLIMSIAAFVPSNADARGGGWHGGGWHGGGWHGGGWHGGRWRGGGWRGGGWGWGVGGLGLGLGLGYPYYNAPYYASVPGSNCGWVRVRRWRHGGWVIRRVWRCW